MSRLLLLLSGVAQLPESHCCLLARRLSSIAASSSTLAAWEPSGMAAAARRMATSEATRTASALSAEPSTSAPSKPSFVPSWLKSLLPGGKHLSVEDGPPQPPPQEPAAPAAAASSEEATRKKQYLEYLEANKDLTVDGFIDINKQVFSNASPPKPRVLQINRMHPDFKRFIDWKRVSYLRTMQHERISSLMTEEEKQRIKDEGMPILQDKRFLQTIADRSAIFIDHEVKDCVQGYLETRDHMRRMYRWVVVLGEPEPVTQAQQKRALKEMKALEEDEERLEKLERQDRSHCPILPALHLVGHDATCSRTGLKFHQCCGGAQGRPKVLAVREKMAEDRAVRGFRAKAIPRSERSRRKLIKARNDSAKWERS